MRFLPFLVLFGCAFRSEPARGPIVYDTTESDAYGVPFAPSNPPPPSASSSTKEPHDAPQPQSRRR